MQSINYWLWNQKNRNYWDRSWYNFAPLHVSPLAEKESGFISWLTFLKRNIYRCNIMASCMHPKKTIVWMLMSIVLVIIYQQICIIFIKQSKHSPLKLAIPSRVLHWPAIAMDGYSPRLTGWTGQEKSLEPGYGHGHGYIIFLDIWLFYFKQIIGQLIV